MRAKVREFWSLLDKDLPTPVHEIDSTPALEDEDDDEYEDEKSSPRKWTIHNELILGC